jgi:hypothetical protein
MSEALPLNRRTFLTGLAGLAMSACTAISQEPKTARAPAQPPAKPAPDAQLIASLKEFLLARYEIDLANHKNLPADKKPLLKTEVPATARASLEERLAAAGIDRAVIGQLEKYEDAQALEDYFARFDMPFRLGIYNLFNGYELLRLSEPTQRKVTLFGKEHEVLVREIIEDVIPHSSLHALKYLTTTFVRGGQYNHPSKTIELRPNTTSQLAKSLAEGYIEEHAKVEENRLKQGYMDELITRLPQDKEFWHQLRKQARLKAHKPLYDLGGTFDDFARRVYERMTRDILLHEAMHAVNNSGDYSFLENSKYRKDLLTIKRWNDEMMCYLSSMAHGSALGTLGDILLYLPFGANGEPHFIAAVKLIDKMVEYVQKNRKQYPEIDFSRLGVHVLKQFPSLSEEQVKATVKGVYDTVYRGRSLRDFVYDFLPDDEKK